MSREKYRVAVVGGAGTWGRNYLRAFAAHPDCQVVALIDRARDRRRAFAEHYAIEHQFDDLDEFLCRDVPDIVAAVVPVAANPGTVIASAEAGVKVVSCEKPIAAQLSQADDMVRICRERGTVFSCGSVYSGIPHLTKTLDWVRQGHLGQIAEVAIPSGLPKEMAGGGCVQLSLLRLFTGMEVEWVEGWTLPPAKDWSWPPDVPQEEIDCPGYGRLGLSSGLICDMLAPGEHGCPLALGFEQGRLWIASPHPVFIRGQGAASSPVFPTFLQTPPGNFFTLRIERLLRACDTGRDELDSGRNYHQALEIAIALKWSHCNAHRRVALPLKDRSLRIVPHPYRLQGGDVAGWESIGYQGPPEIE